MADEKGSITPYRVLVVEDDPVSATALRCLLEPIFKVEVAGTMMDGLNRIKDEPHPDAILLDLVLPNGRGLAMVALYRQRFGNLPIVVYTIDAQIPTQDLIREGACDVLRKPFDSLDQVEDALVKAVARRQVNDWVGPIERRLAEVQQPT